MLIMFLHSPGACVPARPDPFAGDMCGDLTDETEDFCIEQPAACISVACSSRRWGDAEFGCPDETEEATTASVSIQEIAVAAVRCEEGEWIWSVVHTTDECGPDIAAVILSCAPQVGIY